MIMFVAGFPALRSIRLLSLLLGSLLVSSCLLPSRTQRIQDAIYELNLGMRFSRTELTLERVAPTERSHFLARHQHWYRDLRIADLELAGLEWKGERDADVRVAIGWQRVSEQELRTTLVKQQWHNFRGTWLLVQETPIEGDEGLFADNNPPVP